MRRLAAALAALALPAAAPSASAALRDEPCTSLFDVPGAKCVSLKVPLDRSGRLPGSVKLFAERVPAEKKSKSAMVVFPGGPGASASLLGALIVPAVADAMKDHDLLLFDQRGTGRSDYLDCDLALTPTYYVPLGENTHQIGKVVERCANKLGARRGLYTTRETVEDLEDVRAAMGIDKLVLVGVSYGTVDALAYARAHPEHTDRVVVDSLVSDAGLDAFGLNSVRALPRVLRRLCRGGGCDRFTQDPVADLNTLTQKLERAPMRSKRSVEFAGCRLRPSIMRSKIYALLRSADEDPQLLAQLPVALAEAARGRPYQLSVLEAGAGSPYFDYCALVQLFRRLVGRSVGIKEDIKLAGKLFSGADEFATVCEESVFPWPRDSKPSDRQRLAEQALAPLPDSAFYPLDRATILGASLIPLCKWWVAKSEPQPSPSSPLPHVPLLILAGLDDLRTPAEDALALARTAPGARILFVPDVGHSVLVNSPCARRAFKHFMNDELFGECHKHESHAPPPAPRVKPLENGLIEFLQNLPVP